MKREEIMATLGQLAQSQGFYGRLLWSLIEMRTEDPEEYDRAMTELEGLGWHDALDLIFYFET